MVSKKTVQKKNYNGENLRLTITHGILLSHGTFDRFIHEMDEITANDVKRENKKVNWEETKVFDNSNPGRYQNLFFYRERWR